MGCLLLVKVTLALETYRETIWAQLKADREDYLVHQA